MLSSWLRAPGMASAGEMLIELEAGARGRAARSISNVWSALGITARSDVQQVSAAAEVVHGRHRDTHSGTWKGGAEVGSTRRTVYWRERGRSDGTPLVLLNGYSASGISWPAAWLHLLDPHCRVISVDNRGTGWSRYTDAPYRIADLADDVRDVLDDAGIERAFVLGLSMGGMIAQEVAMRHSSRVMGLVAVGTRPPAPAQLKALPRFTAALLQAPARGMPIEPQVRAAWLDCCAPGFTDPDGELDEMVDRILERVTPRPTLLSQLRAVTMWHGAARLERLDVPTLVVHGDEDRLMSIGNATRIARLVPGAEYEELRGIGHLVPLEAGLRLADLVLDFVDRHGD